MVMMRSQVSRLGTLSGMELPVDLLGELAADALHLRQVFHARTHHALQSAEPRQQLFAALRAHSRNALEARGGAPLGAPRPVPRDRKPVRLVANVLDQVQPGMIGREPHYALADPQLLQSGLALRALRDSYERDIRNSDFGESRSRGAELPLAAVDEDRIRSDALSARDAAVT